MVTFGTFVGCDEAAYWYIDRLACSQRRGLIFSYGTSCNSDMATADFYEKWLNWRLRFKLDDVLEKETQGA